MKIVGVAACTAGIAHTYLAKEKLVRAAEKLGHTIKIETQGTIGIETPLTEEEIAAADVVILAIDVKITGEERFKSKPVIRIGTTTIIKNAIGFVEQVEKALKNKNKKG